MMFLMFYTGYEISCDKAKWEEAIDKIKLDSRHYAKRQLTWFRREKETIWINRPSFDSSQEKILDFIIKNVNEKGIL